MEIQIVLTNHFGEFKGKQVTISTEQYEGLTNLVKNFYLDGGFELTLEDETFVVFPPDVVKQSYIKINKIT
jgi:hypothetical protein